MFQSLSESGDFQHLRTLLPEVKGYIYSNGSEMSSMMWKRALHEIL